MKTLNQLYEAAGKFHWSSPMDDENNRTLSSIAKYNDGVFKSTKQRWFLLRRFKESSFGMDVKFAGLKLKKDQFNATTSGYMMFGKKGAGQGTRRIEKVYIMDEWGVVEIYKLGFNYYEGGGASSVDPKKTKREWKRPSGAKKKIEELKELVDAEDSEREKKQRKETKTLGKSIYMGKIKERIKDIRVTVLRQNFFDTQWGRSAITVMRTDEGNMLHHFGKNPLSKGDKATIDFTVKDHAIAEVNKWNKTPYNYTLVTRVKAK